MWIFLVFRYENLEDKCYEYVDRTFGTELYELVEISNEEKDSLGIEKGLNPSRRYYEIKKCLRDQYDGGALVIG